MEYYSAIKKNESLPFATWMDLEGIMFSEISQTEKGKYCMISLIFSLKNKQMYIAKQSLTDTENKLVVTSEGREGRTGHNKGMGLRHINYWAFLVAQWLRILLPLQGTWVRSLVRENPTCRGATKPVSHNYGACALEPTSHNY